MTVLSHVKTGRRNTLSSLFENVSLNFDMKQSSPLVPFGNMFPWPTQSGSGLSLQTWPSGEGVEASPPSCRYKSRYWIGLAGLMLIHLNPEKIHMVSTVLISDGSNRTSRGQRTSRFSSSGADPPQIGEDALGGPASRTTVASL